MIARIRPALARLAEAENARSHGRGHCPLCSLAERRARAQIGMAKRHPERITRELPADVEEQLEELAGELWPRGEYTQIITDTQREDRP